MKTETSPPFDTLTAPAPGQGNGLPPVAHVDVSVYRVPTQEPESDGTAHWDATTMVLVELTAQNGARGLGYTYGAAAAASLVKDLLGGMVVGSSLEEIPVTWRHMVDAVRNPGRPGIAATAIAAVDMALWDLRGHVEQRSIADILGRRRDTVPIYGSGGFTSYTVEHLQAQLGGWARQGIPRVKMKVGTDWGTRREDDVERVAAARDAIGDAALFVDANGAFMRDVAIEMAQRFTESAVSYFEEPVTSDSLEDLAAVRSAVEMDVAAGEYAYDPWYVDRMLSAGAVDIQQADITRCLGVTGWVQAAHLADAHQVRFSGHCAPGAHAVVACAVPAIEHLEYFHDHVRIERELFEGFPEVRGGCLQPDLSRPGLGLELRRGDAERYRV